MSYHYIDTDEWESVCTHVPCGSCGGVMARCNGACTRSSSYGMRRRAPEEVARIKAERERLRQDAVLVEADAIRAVRAASVRPGPVVRGTGEAGRRAREEAVRATLARLMP